MTIFMLEYLIYLIVSLPAQRALWAELDGPG
jgi:hypothetical protein